MGSNPINLALRLFLEVAAYVGMGYWGWTRTEGALRFLLAAGIPVLWGVIWGTFAVPDDPSRSGNAPVPVPGILRLALELAFFAAATWALFDAGLAGPGWALGCVTLVHYLVSYDRIRWLIGQ